MAPVSITLVANWRGEGSSEVVKMELVDENGDGDGGGSSMGPSSKLLSFRIGIIIIDRAGVCAGSRDRE